MTRQERLTKLKQLQRAVAIVSELESKAKRAGAIVSRITSELKADKPQQKNDKPKFKAEVDEAAEILLSNSIITEPSAGETVVFKPAAKTVAPQPSGNTRIGMATLIQI